MSGSNREIVEEIYAASNRGNLVISAVDLTATARPTGKQVVMPFRVCFRVLEGLVVDLQPFYYDTAAIAAAFAA